MSVPTSPGHDATTKGKSPSAIHRRGFTSTTFGTELISLASDSTERSQGIPCENYKVAAPGREVKIRLDGALENYKNWDLADLR